MSEQRDVPDPRARSRVVVVNSSRLEGFGRSSDRSQLWLRTEVLRPRPQQSSVRALLQDVTDEASRPTHGEDRGRRHRAAPTQRPAPPAPSRGRVIAGRAVNGGSQCLEPPRRGRSRFAGQRQQRGRTRIALRVVRRAKARNRRLAAQTLRDGGPRRAGAPQRTNVSRDLLAGGAMPLARQRGQARGQAVPTGR